MSRSRVQAVGKAVQSLRPGDEVFGWCTGAFAEYVTAREQQLVKKPANLTFEQAAAVSASAALQSLRRWQSGAGSEGLDQWGVGVG